MAFLSASRWFFPLLLGLTACSHASAATEAVSYGDHRCGKLTGGVPFPCRGPNFTPFSELTCQGRNVVHPLVQRTMLDAYRGLAHELPQRTWQYGDMGKDGGGQMAPHRTHQRGVSVDFYMPLLDAQGNPTKMPIDRGFQKLSFDAQGRMGTLRIDWRAVARHLLALEQSGARHGVRLERVIVTPDFHPHLLKAESDIARLLPLFSKREGTVRHDEHYHVDFLLPERLRRPLRCR
jgi:penicillin-insensitive murein DD-endopeptidase